MTNQEIDRLIAEKVMGLHLHDKVKNIDWLAFPIINGEVDYLQPTIIPKYSSDITQAWEVNLKIRQTSISTEEGYLIVAKYIDYIKMSGFMQFSSQDAAKEICLAALKAMGLIDE